MNPFIEAAEALGIHIYLGEVFQNGRFHTEVGGGDYWLVQSLASRRVEDEFWVCNSNGDALSAKYNDATSAVEALSYLMLAAEDSYPETA